MLYQQDLLLKTRPAKHHLYRLNYLFNVSVIFIIHKPSIILH